MSRLVGTLPNLSLRATYGEISPPRRHNNHSSSKGTLALRHNQPLMADSGHFNNPPGHQRQTSGPIIIHPQPPRIAEERMLLTTFGADSSRLLCAAFLYRLGAVIPYVGQKQIRIPSPLRDLYSIASASNTVVNRSSERTP